jgi:hypothetical protein
MNSFILRAMMPDPGFVCGFLLHESGSVPAGRDRKEKQTRRNKPGKESGNEL